MRHYRTFAKALILLLTVLVSYGSYAKSLQARIDRSQVAENGSFQLTLVAEGNAISAPDLTPLRSDFDIEGTSRSTRTSIINGVRNDSISWAITLRPNKKGVLAIPELRAGGLKSNELQITVTDINQTPKAIGTTGVNVSVQLEKGPYYLFQEVPLLVTIETKHPLQQAGLKVPQGDGFKLRQVGEDRVSQTSRNGQNLTLIERNFMLQFDKSGAVQLPPFVLEGKVSDAEQKTRSLSQFAFNDSLFEQLGMNPFISSGTPFRVRSDALKLTIQGKVSSSGNKGDWFLPAKKVELTSEWVDKKLTFEKEKAVVRRIRVQALGARPEQIPMLKLDGNADVKIYLDDSSTSLIQTTQGSVAQKTLLMSVVPLTAGDIALPEIQLEWFNTSTGKNETALLASEVIHVAGSNISQQPQQASGSEEKSAHITPTNRAGQDNRATWYMKFVPVLLFLLTISGWLLWRLWRTRSNERSAKDAFTNRAKDNRPKRTITGNPNRSEHQQLQHLIRVVDRENPQAVYSAFSQWLITCRSLADRSGFEQQLRELESVLFSAKPDANKWDKTTLMRMLVQLADDHLQSKGDTVLPPLYPTNL